MSFDRLARHYDWMEGLLAGRQLQNCRTAFLSDLQDVQSALLVGEGHGRFLAELCRINPTVRICCVDASPKMNAVAKERLLRRGLDLSLVEFVTLPILDFVTDRRFDLVSTQFFLDCFDAPELDLVIRKLATHLQPRGRWLITDFRVPERGWRRQRARLILRLAYLFFRVATHLPARVLTCPTPFLLANGFTQDQRREFNFGLLYAEIWSRAMSGACGTNR